VGFHGTRITRISVGFHRTRISRISGGFSRDADYADLSGFSQDADFADLWWAFSERGFRGSPVAFFSGTQIARICVAIHGSVRPNTIAFAATQEAT
jgi:hypothetical protein